MGMSGGSSNQSSSGYGYNQSLAQSVNGQQVWQPQAQALTGLYGQAQNLANQQQGQVGATAQGLANTGTAASQGGLSALSGIANMQGPLAQYANPNSDLARQQLASATGDIQQNFLRNIMPGITSGAGLTGNIGGSRQAIAQGLAGGDAANAIAKAGTDIYSNMWNTGAQAAAGLTDAASQAAGMIPQAAQGLYNLGMSPFQAQWAPLTSLAGILGGPTALSYGLSQAQSMGEQSQQSTGKSSQFGFSFF
jgi:hypothetical protein